MVAYMKMSKKKYNIIILIISFIILISLITIVMKSSPPWHFSNKDIGYIELRKSGNINPINITETKQISNIIDKLERKKYKFKNFNIGNGWTYRILIYSSKGHLKDEFEINYNNSLSYGLGVYSYSDLDISFISDYFK
jgi:hypothetical protein